MTTDSFLSSYRGKLSARDFDLLSRAVRTLDDNIYPADHPAFGGIRFLSPGKNYFRGAWNWDTAFHAIGVSYFDAALAKEQITGFLSYIRDDGMLPDNVRESDGVPEYHSSKPPVFAFAATEVARRTGDTGFLCTVYPALKKNVAFWENDRSDDGLFFYGASIHDGRDAIYAGWESGWDNAVRWDVPGGASALYAIDLNCYMVMTYRALAEIAAVAGDDPIPWREKENTLVARIERDFWCAEAGAYTDVLRENGKPTGCLSPASFMPLYIGITSRDRAESLARLAASDAFRSMMPTAAYTDPAFSDDYWRGLLWLNVAYFAAKGLKNYGFPVADAIRENILTLCDEVKEGVYENYDTLLRAGRGCDHFSWSAVFLMEFILNF